MGSFKMVLKGSDLLLMTGVVNEGIDARLEAFVNSKFAMRAGALHCNVGSSDMTVLLRRLVERYEKGHEAAGTLADSIVTVEYGVDARE